MPRVVQTGRAAAIEGGPALCPICRRGLAERYRGVVAEETGDRFGVDACPGCGLGRTRPIPDDLGPYYDTAYHGERHGATARLCHRRRLRWVRRFASGGRSLLDFGCGDGGFLRLARAEGWECVGVERDRRTPSPGDFPVVENLEGLGESPRFDCVTFWHVLEHLDDPVGVLAGLRSRIRPGGVVLAAVPNFGSWQSRATGASWLHLDLPRHLWHFTAESLARTFRAAGFRSSSIDRGEIEYDVVGWSQSLLNRALGGRNEFFKAMSGRPGRASTGFDRLQVVAGLGLSAVAVLPAWLEGRIGLGGTLVVRARVDD